MRKTLVTLFLAVVVFYLPVMMVNNGAFQQWFLRTYRPFAPWKIEMGQMVLQPIPPRLTIKKFHAAYPAGHRVQFEQLKIRFKLWRFLRGQVGVDPLEIDALAIHIAQPLKAKPKKERKGLKLRTLLLIQNLLIEESHIRNVSLHLPKQKTIQAKEIQVELKPHLLGGTSLKIIFHGVERPKIERAVFEVTTDFDHWSKNFPYINDVEGALLLKEASFGRLPVEIVDARLKYRDFHLYSERFAVQIKGRRLLGELDSRLRKQTFKIKLTTQEPIAIPEVGSAIRTFNIEGAMQIDLEMEGKGFKTARSGGKGHLKLTHRFAADPEVPIEADTAFDWSGGTVRLGGAKLKAGEAFVTADGAIHLTPPSLDLKFSARDFPIQHFFNKFEDKNLHPIFGLGTVEGQVQGWGKKIHLVLKGEAREGGYAPLLAQRAKVDLELTYDGLKLAGAIFTNDKQTGGADLKIDYGPKRPGEVRPKTVHLNAEFKNHPLETLLEKPYLSGTADASLQISGPAKGFEGKGKVSAATGELFGVAFESLEFPFRLTPKQLVIPEAHWIFPHLETRFKKPLAFDFMPGGVRVAGSPLEGLKLDLEYRAQGQELKIKSFEYKNSGEPDYFASVSGTAAKDNFKLTAKGNLDLAQIQWMSRLIREGEGPFAFDLAAGGSTANPSLKGWIRFNQNLLSLRAYPLTVEDLTGMLEFSGRTLRTEKLTGLLGAGSFKLKGELTHENLAPQNFDLALKGKQLYFRNEAGNFRMEYDADLHLTGSRRQALLKGKLGILDGRYTKDFNIIEEFKKAKKPSKEIQTAVAEKMPIELDLQVRNPGDLLIDNNVGRIELAADLHLGGNTLHPLVEGSVEIAEGEIHYLGLDFEITRGFMEFRDPYTIPYLEVEAEQEIADAHLTARLHGPTDNLVMDLSGNSASLGPLERKDVISLVLFGMTSSERHQQSQYQQFELGPELAAEQVAHILQRPIARATGLDVFRLETTPTEEGRSRRFHLGKKITDRFHVEFTSDVDREDAVQTFLLEYWLTDFLILKGGRETEEEYQLNVGFRVKSR